MKNIFKYAIPITLLLSQMAAGMTTPKTTPKLSPNKRYLRVVTHTTDLDMMGVASRDIVEVYHSPSKKVIFKDTGVAGDGGKFSEDSRYFAYFKQKVHPEGAAVREILKVYDLENPEEAVIKEEKVSHYQLSPRGSLIAILTDSRELKLFNLRSPETPIMVDTDVHSFEIDQMGQYMTIKYRETSRKIPLGTFD